MGLASSSFLEMPLLLIVLGGVFVLLWLRRSKQQKHLQPLPPGPPADPIIGHLRKIPPANQATLFYEWGKIYGDVMYLEVLGQPIVVLNSAEAAVDLLDRRSANYSDRPRFVIMELMGWTRSLVFTGYGRRFQKHRRMAQQYLNMTKSFAYRPVQTQEAHIFLQSMVSGDSDHDKALRRYTTAVIMRIAYGHQITSDDDPYVDLTEAASYALSNAGSPGSTPVDFFPFRECLRMHTVFSFANPYSNVQSHGFPRGFLAHTMLDLLVTIRNISTDCMKFLTRPSGKKWWTLIKAVLALYILTMLHYFKAAGEARPSFLFDLLEALSPEEAADPETLLDIRGITGMNLILKIRCWAHYRSSSWQWYSIRKLRRELKKRLIRSSDPSVSLNFLIESLFPSSSV
ncbi:hypothetical protein DXG01_010412 [Tephrocybe rancida]|nr:hypothetical protein DXG01_010412 [Tephrocybe rancida]